MLAYLPGLPCWHARLEGWLATRQDTQYRCVLNKGSTEQWTMETAALSGPQLLMCTLLWPLPAVAEHQLWRELCLRAHPAVAAAAASIDAFHIPTFISGLPGPVDRQSGGTEAAGAAPGASSGGSAGAGAAAGEAAARRSAFFKHLHFRLTAPLARESLIAEALGASSTDHPQVAGGCRRLDAPSRPCNSSESEGSPSWLQVFSVHQLWALHRHSPLPAGERGKRAAAHQPQPGPDVLLVSASVIQEEGVGWGGVGVGVCVCVRD